MITAKEISERLSRQAATVAERLLPNGKTENQGKEWAVGSVNGEAGQSLKVCIKGDKAGTWKDFANNDGGDLIDLWAATNGIGIGDAMREARDYLGVTTPVFAGSSRREYRTPDKPKATRPKASVLDYLHGRGFTDETIAAFKVGANEAGDEIIFPFIHGGQLANVKYLKLARPGGKKVIRQEKDAEPCLFGWQAMPDRARSVVLTEGEFDAMSWSQQGFPALSVWAGAGNTQWIENEWERLSQFDRIYVALDADQAGKDGVDAIVERLGRARCRIVTTPYKDANECLQKGLDRECFRDIIDAAKSLDPKELRSASEYRDAVMALFFPPEGSLRGWLTPFDELNRLRVVFHPSELILINGINGHGKTKLVSQIALALMRQAGKCCMASMEIKTPKLLESMTKQASGREEPSKPFIEHIQQYWDGRLWMFDVVGTAKATYLLDVFRYARSCYGITCFFVDSLAKCGIDDDDYNGQKRFVEALCDFKNETDATVFLVTHSRKLDSESRFVDKMDVKGSGTITDLVDVVTTLWRNKEKEEKSEQNRDRGVPDAKWHWQKNRNGDFEGICQLWYDKPSFQFSDSSTARPHAYVDFVWPIQQTPEVAI